MHDQQPKDEFQENFTSSEQRNELNESLQVCAEQIHNKADDSLKNLLGKRPRENNRELLPKMQLRKVQRTNYAQMINPHLLCDEEEFQTERPSILNLNREGASFLKYCVLEK